MHFRPLHDRVVVRRMESQEKTAGGIIIPDTAKEKPQEGEIVAADPGARSEKGELVPLDVKAGDRTPPAQCAAGWGGLAKPEANIARRTLLQFARRMVPFSLLK